MEVQRAIVVPDTWMNEASWPEERMNKRPFFRIIPVPGYEHHAKGRLKKSIINVLKVSGVQSALIVLPVGYAAGAFVKHWPELFIRTKNGVLVASVCFAGTWAECRKIVEPDAGTAGEDEPEYNVTCQYQPPYTEVLSLWEKAGAQGFHPGDYSRDEFLNALREFKGHWLYWGHSDHEKLRAYHHLYSGDLLSHRPARPLQSTLWFSCSTLAGNNGKSIALDWYSSGATRCILAGTGNMNTTANQLLSAAFLEAIIQKKGAALDAVLFGLLSQDEETFGPVLNHYRLMGPPWMKLGALKTVGADS